jgi:hypothetical protein
MTLVTWGWPILRGRIPLLHDGGNHHVKKQEQNRKVQKP